MVDCRLGEICERSSGRPMSNQEIAQALGGLLTPQRVGQITDKAVRKIRNRLMLDPEIREALGRTFFFHNP